MQFTWNGGVGSYTDAANWTPQGVPLYDNDASALIQSGTAILTNAEPNGVDIILSGPSPDNQPTLVLDNAALGPDVRLTLVPPNVEVNPPNYGYATIVVNGYSTTQANINLGGFKTSPDVLTVMIAPYGQLNQAGTIEVSSSSLQVTGTDGAPATLNNDGRINVTGGAVGISADLVGTGTIAFLPGQSGSGDFARLDGSVAPTQHISFSSNAFASLRLNDPSAFRGVIDGFDAPFESVTLADTAADRAYFAQVTPEAGALLVLNGQEVVSALTVTGVHASDAYGVSSNLDGSATVRPVFPTLSS